MKNYFSNTDIKPIFENSYIDSLPITFRIKLFESIDLDSDSFYDAYDEWNELYRNMFQQLLDDLLKGGKKDKWKTVNPGPIKRIWIEFAQYGMLRHRKMEVILDKIVDMTLVNCMKIYIYSLIYGRVEGTSIHDELQDQFDLCFTMTEEEEEEYKKNNPDSEEQQQQDTSIKSADPTLFPVQYNVPSNARAKMLNRNEEKDCEIYPMSENEFMDKFDEYTENHHFGVSDVLGTTITKAAIELSMADDVRSKITQLDRIFNLVHIAGSVSHWFVKGGEYALEEISGSQNLVFA